MWNKLDVYIKGLFFFFLVGEMFILWLGFKRDAIVSYKYIVKYLQIKFMLSRICLKIIHSWGTGSEGGV